MRWVRKIKFINRLLDLKCIFRDNFVAGLFAQSAIERNGQNLMKALKRGYIEH